jgi:hypothetical protein
MPGLRKTTTKNECISRYSTRYLHSSNSRNQYICETRSVGLVWNIQGETYRVQMRKPVAQPPLRCSRAGKYNINIINIKEICFQDSKRTSLVQSPVLQLPVSWSITAFYKHKLHMLCSTAMTKDFGHPVRAVNRYCLNCKTSGSVDLLRPSF